MKKRGVRDQIVLATKYATAWRGGKDGAPAGELIINTGGLGTKSLRLSLDKSLENFQTSYIDLVSLTSSILLEPQLIPQALYSLVGFHNRHPRTHAIPQRRSQVRKSSLSRNLRYSCLDRSQSQSIRPRPRTPPIFRIPGRMECLITRHRTRYHSNDS